MGDDGGRGPGPHGEAETLRAGGIRPRDGARSIALVGPFGSGKTTLLEAILARTGALTRQGSVTAGTTVGDAAPEARAHGMSVELNVAETRFMGDDYVFLDCPGSAEFLAEADAVLPAVDCAVVVCEADPRRLASVQLILKRLADARVPYLLFLNKIDRGDVGVRDTLAMLQPASPVPLVLRQIPLRDNGRPVGFIDLALERAFVWREHAPSEMIPLTDDARAAEVGARFAMLERLADYDDDLMESLIADLEPPRDRVFEDLRAELAAGLISPVFIGSAERGNGILRLMKALRHEAPGLAVLTARTGVAPGAEPLVRVVKTLHGGHGGKLSLVRVLAGTIEDGTVLTGPDGVSDRVSGIYRLTGRDAVKREAAGPGDTVALGKLEHARTGDLLTGGRVLVAAPALARPAPVMALAVRALERRDEVKLSAALARAAEEDPGLAVETDPDLGETLLHGQGEMHLRVALERLQSRYGLNVASQPPSVAYRETIRGAVTQPGRHKKQSGGHGQFGDVVLEIAPLPRGSGNRFAERITGGAVPRQYIPGVETGVMDSLKRGPLGFPVVDVAVTLTDGSYHTVDSSDQAFQAAARIAMRDGLAACRPVLLEPIERVEIHCPSEATARVNAIVASRRGQILGFDARAGWPGWDVVEALMPASETGDLIVDLRSATQGVAGFARRFDHLKELDGRAAETIVSRRGGSRAA
ncbi:elongation factor G [Mongoliimonas terrestris]|uniref:elongation factor G n=1 Tax=Mongoliimonas terrestris TaxID=1709001 RepID=UPI0009F84743|nr:elongation factor G [Mongoliimonas terrestris]